VDSKAEAPVVLVLVVVAVVAVVVVRALAVQLAAHKWNRDPQPHRLAAIKTHCTR
jgi:hypothetical protein